MIEWFQDFLSPYYVYIKFVHVLAVMIWLFSTAVAYTNYLLPVLKDWARNRGDARRLAMRNWAMERFDDGVVLEHIAFPVIMITGPMLWLIAGYGADSNWFVLKLLLVFGFFLPLEIFDYYLSHFGLNKRQVRETGSLPAYEAAIDLHWRFFIIVSGPVALIGVAIVFLAIVKPGF